MRRCLLFLCLGLTAGPGFGQSFDPAALRPVGLGLGGINYWTAAPFANGARNTGSAWLEYTTDWGSSVSLWNNPQFDVNGYPRWLNPGRKLRLMVFALHAETADRPASWPSRTRPARGKITLTWRGEADIRPNTGAFLAAESSGAATGLLVNGRRTYRVTSSAGLTDLRVEALNSNNPLTELRVWLPDPANPDNATLEGQVFHPTLLARIAELNPAFLRFMDWGSVNANPQQDWSDRRPPRHVIAEGVLNPRPPAAGFAGNRQTGTDFEHMVLLANAAGKDLWLCVPHLASDTFLTNLARLIRFGSDGTNAYAAPQANPVFPPLRADLRVYVEYSNEIWSNGDAFPQGNWAQEQAGALGITKPQFNARRFCQVWRVFRSVFDAESHRVVRVAAVWTGSSSYTTPFLQEIAAYGPTLSPPQGPDVIAPTTYFGNGMQDWAWQQALAFAGTTNQWFFTTNTYTNGSVARPVSIAPGDAYWSGARVTNHLQSAFREWKRRLLSGSTLTGGGPDANGIGGGFDIALRATIASTFGRNVPILSYEGGPSIYTDGYDSGDARDAGLTTFMELLNRQPAMREVYRIHLELARAKGLWTHGAFVEVSRWGRYGQWGHLEYQEQPAAQAPKWQLLLDWQSEAAALRHIDLPAGAVPAFATAAKLPFALHGQPYSVDLVATGGTGGLLAEIVGSLLPAGLGATPVAGEPGTLRLSGTASGTGDAFVLARVRDADGDAASRTFAFMVAGGPGTIIDCSFEGANPAQRLPWTNAYYVKPGVTNLGWQRGAAGSGNSGIFSVAGNDALVFYVNAPADEANATLALALTENEFWRLTLRPPDSAPLDLRQAEVRFSLRRDSYHAPRRWAVFTSVAGFATNQAVFNSPRDTSQGEVAEYVFRLPDTPAYSNRTGAVEIRIVPYSGQYGGHNAALTGFKLTSADTRAPAPTGASVDSSANPSTYGQPVTLTASVQTNGALAPAATGTVVFRVNGVPAATNAIAAGQAAFTTAALPAGVHAVLVEYSGDALHLPSTNSPALAQLVNPAATTMTLTSSANPSQLGESVTFTATVTSPGGVPGGAVQFRVNGSPAGAPVPLLGGQASFTTAVLPGGDNTVAASHFGDANFQTNTVTLLPTQNVNRPPVAPTVAVPVYLGGTLNYDLLASPTPPTDPDGDPLTIIAVGPPTGGVAATNGGTGFIYVATNASLGAHTFTYTVSDGRGGEAVGEVRVVVEALPAPRLAGLTYSHPVATVTAQGVPGAIYELQCSSNLAETAWAGFAGGTAQAATNDGSLTWQDASASNSPRFYRARHHSGP